MFSRYILHDAVVFPSFVRLSYSSSLVHMYACFHEFIYVCVCTISNWRWHSFSIFYFFFVFGCACISFAFTLVFTDYSLVSSHLPLCSVRLYLYGVFGIMFIIISSSLLLSFYIVIMCTHHQLPYSVGGKAQNTLKAHTCTHIRFSICIIKANAKELSMVSFEMRRHRRTNNNSKKKITTYNNVLAFTFVHFSFWSSYMAVKCEWNARIWFNAAAVINEFTRFATMNKWIWIFIKCAAHIFISLFSRSERSWTEWSPTQPITAVCTAVFFLSILVPWFTRLYIYNLFFCRMSSFATFFHYSCCLRML